MRARKAVATRYPVMCALILVSGFTPFAFAQSSQQVWQGVIRCAAIPGSARIPLRQPIDVVVNGTAAHYVRSVRLADTAIASSYTEAGSGTVGADGSVILTASVTAPRYAFTARYEGKLPPQGGHASLLGFQTWTAGTSEPGYRRACSIELDR